MLSFFSSRGFSQAQGVWQSDKYQELPYRILMPDHYDPNKMYPLVLFLHGIGERGTDNQIQLSNGAELFNNLDYRARYPAIVVVPQCPLGAWWTGFPYRINKIPRPGFLAASLVKTLVQTLSVDPKRVYVTGLSMGAYAVWDFIVRYNDLFAAALPVSGAGDIATARQLTTTPIWAFHNLGDFLINPVYDRQMYVELESRNGLMKYTEYPVWGHDAWTKTFQNTEVLDWLFLQKR